MLHAEARYIGHPENGNVSLVVRFRRTTAGFLFSVTVALLVLSPLVLAVNTSAGAETGTFPNRVFYITRSPPGGPHGDSYTIHLPTFPAPATWWVSLESLGSGSVQVNVYSLQGSNPLLQSSSRLRYIGQESARASLAPDVAYSVELTPYGPSGTSKLAEHFLGPLPPVACFAHSPTTPTTNDAITFDASCSTDPNNDIIRYEWDFDGDGRADAAGTVVQRLFATAGTFTVTLAVTDATGLGAVTHKQVVVKQANLPPMARLNLSRDLMTVVGDPTGSHDPDGTIATYDWDWGDGTLEQTPSNAKVIHAYAVPGLYRVTLRVTDDLGGVGTAAGNVTVNTSTADVRLYDFFNVPYPDYWFDRNQKYGDIIVNDRYPYVDYYPWVNREDAFLHSSYRMHVDARNISQMTVERPLIFPICSDLKLDPLYSYNVPIWNCPTARAGGSISLDLRLDYINRTRARYLNNLWHFNVLTPANLDGFISELRGTMEMDYVASQWMFGVTGDPVGWWTSPLNGNPLAATDPYNLTDGPVEEAWVNYFFELGLNKYDIYNAFEYTYSMWSMQLNPTVIPDPSAPGGSRLRITMDIVTWGEEVLLSRLFYWGDGCYPDGRCWVRSSDGSIGYTGEFRGPSGWWHQELGWFENFRLRGRLGERSDFSIDTSIAYQFRAWAEPGADGQYSTVDDVLTWDWEPSLMDYVPAGWAGAGVNPFSELTAWSEQTYVHATPGTTLYGTSYRYDYAPTAFSLREGETLSLNFPAGNIAFYDWKSHWNSSVSDPLPCSNRADNCGLMAFSDAAVYLPEYASTTFMGFWDPSSRTLVFMGPFLPSISAPLTHGLPRIEMGRASIVGALSPGP